MGLLAMCIICGEQMDLADLSVDCATGVAFCDQSGCQHEADGLIATMRSGLE